MRLYPVTTRHGQFLYLNIRPNVFSEGGKIFHPIKRQVHVVTLLCEQRPMSTACICDKTVMQAPE